MLKHYISLARKANVIEINYTININIYSETKSHLNSFNVTLIFKLSKHPNTTNIKKKSIIDK